MLYCFLMSACVFSLENLNLIKKTQLREFLLNPEHKYYFAITDESLTNTYKYLFLRGR